MTRFIVIFTFLVWAELAAMLMLVMYVKGEDAVRGVVQNNKTRWYLTLFTTNPDFLDLKNTL